jgi:[CysO sulfur-carrier protein]-S-L-cysteine hydrolase
VEIMPEKNRPHILQIKRPDYELMRLDVASRSPEEACGLLAGQLIGERYEVMIVFPTTNMLHSTTRYRIEPAELLASFNQMEAQGFELVGIYHSHPNGPDGPSPTDIAEAYYPEAAYLIWSRQDGEWACKAYTIVKQTIQPVGIQLL